MSLLLCCFVSRFVGCGVGQGCMCSVPGLIVVWCGVEYCVLRDSVVCVLC